MKRFRSERERLEFEAFEREDREAQERPVRQATATLQRTAGELIKIQRRALLDMADKDIVVTPSLQGARMTKFDAQVFNKAEAEAFVQENPDYYPNRHNFELLSEYMTRNGIDICDREMWKAAYLKFKSVGLLEEASQPDPIPEAIPAPQEPELPRLPLGYTSPSGWQREPGGFQTGFDPNTGMERVYTSLEIDRMTAEEYKRAFKLSIPALTKVNFGQ